MLCKWCGMESMTTDQCSWCHRSFTTATAEEEVAPSASADVPAEAVAAPTAQAIELPDSPLAAGLTAPVAPPPIAATPPVPPAAAPAPAPAPAPANRPVIGVRRPGGARPNTPAPAAGMPAARQTPSARPPAPVPAPPVAAPRPTAPPTRPAPPPIRPAQPAPPASSRPTVPAALANTGRPPTPVEPTVSLSAAAQPAPPADANVPKMGTFTAQKSKYYAGQVVDPVSGTHYDADTGKPTAGPLSGAQATRPAQPQKKQPDVVLKWDKTPQIPFSTRLSKFLSIFAVILVITAVAAFGMRELYAIPMVLANFLSGLIMPALKLVPWHDEDSDDWLLFVVLTMVFGPFIPLVIYGVLWMLRQSGNPAILGCFVVSAVTRLVVELAAQTPSLSHFMPWQPGAFSIGLLFLNWAGVVTLAGWITGNVFHKLDE